MGTWLFLLKATSACFLFASDTYVHLHILVLVNQMGIQIVREAEGSFQMNISKIPGQRTTDVSGSWWCTWTHSLFFLNEMKIKQNKEKASVSHKPHDADPGEGVILPGFRGLEI